MDFLEKLQNQPEHIKKLILWSVIIIIAAVLVFFWFRTFLKKIEGFEADKLIEQLEIEKLKKETGNVMESLEDEQIEEGIKSLEEELKLLEAEVEKAEAEEAEETEEAEVQQ